MCQDISLFTGFWVVWFFVTGAQSEIYFTIITRSELDIFTNSLCGNCSKYGATEHGKGSCRCNKVPGQTCSVDPGSIFLRSKGKCMSDCNFKRNRADECFSWELEAIKVINVDSVNSSYTFQQKQIFKYQSCQWTKSIEFLDAGENWTAINISANAFQVLKYKIPGKYFTLKVTERSAALANLSGHIMKLGLNCTRTQNRGFDSRCLIFKSQGNLKFPLCNYTRVSPCTGTPVITTWTSSIVPITTTSWSQPSNSVITTWTSSIVPITTTSWSQPSSSVITTWTSSIVPIATTSWLQPSSSVITTWASSTTTHPPPVKPLDNRGMIVALVAVGAVLSCALAYLLYSYKRQSRDLQAREVNDFAVIRNPGPQIYRVQEEPLYAELSDIDPNDIRSLGNSEINSNDKQVVEDAVFLNPYARVASFARARLTTDPLPSKPDMDQNTRPENFAGYVYQNDGYRHDKEDASIVLKNPRVEETLCVSLPKSGNDLDRLPESPGKEEMVPEHHHPSKETAGDGNDEDLDYQGLLKGKRPQSMFVCPSCNKNKDQDYQRLSRPGTCPHWKTDERGQKNPSVYESLSPERGARDSLYARPSDVGETADVEDVDKRTKDVTPEYHTLEPEETEASQEPDEPACHDYNVLEEPEQTCSEFDEDNNKLSGPRPTEEDPEMPCETSGILSMESNPAYAVPWKMKDTEIPLRKRSYSM